MNLYIIRHAWAEERDGSRWPNDDLRPLTAVGRERFAQVVKRLVRAGMTPGIIATSPLTRCVETAGLVAAGFADRPKVVELNDLRSGSNLQGLLQWTIQHADKHDEIAWVGHAPDVSRLTAALIDDGDSLIRFTKGAVAAIRFNDPPALASGELQWLATAKLLGV
jgi:phosphohistidine phosphatase